MSIQRGSYDEQFAGAVTSTENSPRRIHPQPAAMRADDVPLAKEIIKLSRNKRTVVTGGKSTTTR